MKVDKAADTTSIAPANNSANWTVSRALRERKDRIASIIHHRHCRRRPQPNREAGASLTGRDALLNHAARSAQIRVPNGDSPRRVRGIAEQGDALRVGARGPGA